MYKLLIQIDQSSGSEIFPSIQIKTSENKYA